jgi:predicted house-cleaning noncanonical NTP pyrophosphatase (MazG superfamily)
MPEKLVRDRIPQLIRAEGGVPRVRVAGTAEYRALLRAKLTEEVEEFLAAGVVEELADVLEVVLALADELGFGGEELERVRAAKKAERGGFAGRVVWSAPS